MNFLKLVLLSVMVISCSKKSPGIKPHIKLHELGIEVSRSELSENQRKIMLEVDKENVVDLSLVTNAVIERHKWSFLGHTKSDVEIVKMKLGDAFKHALSLGYAEDTSPLQLSAFKPLSKGAAGMNPHDFKVHYEKAISKMHGGKSMLYNKEHVSVFSSVFANRIQSYSGTILFDILLRDQRGSDYYALNQVFIYENGHVLPGYMLKESGEWVLYGVETIVAGKAKKYFGPSKSLSQVRVVDAHVAMALDALDGKITNPQEVMLAALIKTAVLYDIPLKSIEAGLRYSILSDPSEVSKRTAEYLKSSLFSFGSSSSMLSDDIVRPKLDELYATPGVVFIKGLHVLEVQVGDVLVLKPKNKEEMDILIEEADKSRASIVFSKGELSIEGGYQFLFKDAYAKFYYFPTDAAGALPEDLAEVGFEVAPYTFVVSGEEEGRLCLDPIRFNGMLSTSCFNYIYNTDEYSLESLKQIFGETMSVEIIRCSSEENEVCPRKKAL